jgi:hypothetical protein
MCAPLYRNRRVVVGGILSHVSATGQSSLGPVRPWKGKALRGVGAIVDSSVCEKKFEKGINEKESRPDTLTEPCVSSRFRR